MDFENPPVFTFQIVLHIYFFTVWLWWVIFAGLASAPAPAQTQVVVPALCHQNAVLTQVVQPPGPTVVHMPQPRYLCHNVPEHLLNLLMRGEIPGNPPFRRHMMTLFTFSFHMWTQTTESPLLYLTQTEKGARRRCCFKHSHESQVSGHHTMIRIDRHHTRFQHVHFQQSVCEGFLTLDTFLDICTFDDIGNQSGRIHLLPGGYTFRTTVLHNATSGPYSVSTSTKTYTSTLGLSSPSINSQF